MTSAVPRGAEPCICGSEDTYNSCCLAKWSQDFMREVLREGKFKGPQKFVESIEVQTPHGWESMTAPSLHRPPPDPKTRMRFKLSEFGEEIARRMAAAGLYDEPRVHPSRRKPPPPPPRKRRRPRR